MMNPNTIEQEDADVATIEALPYVLTLHNDDFNTFDWVIKCLVNVCNHKFLQATQCAHIVHNNGKCDVKKGDYDEIKTMYEKLQSANLTVSMQESET